MSSPSLPYRAASARAGAFAIPALRWWARWAPLLGVVALAFALDAWRISMSGYGNTYYAAATRSMTLSWKAFFFGAFDPGSFITVDKPPFFLWIDALSARAFGYSSWSTLLPSAFAGAATAGLLWVTVRRHLDAFAATIAGVVFALTPIVVAVDRLNLPEPFYVLALVGAGAAVLESLRRERWWAWAALGGVLVGVAFNTKMLAGWIPGPALVLALIVGVGWGDLFASRAGWRERWRASAWSDRWRAGWLPVAGRIAVFGVVALVVSLSWVVVVDAWPASSRPYIGGSANNTVSDLVLGYNGLGRVEGNSPFGGNNPFAGGRGGGFAPFRNPFAPPPPAPSSGGFALPFGLHVPNPFSSGSQNATPAPFGGITRAPGPTTGIGAGGIIAGRPDTWRMFDAANGPQIGWLLPFAVLGGLLALVAWWPDRMRRAAMVLFLGWVLLFGGVFSEAQGIYHSYYTYALAPGIAVLVGAGALAATDLVRRSRWWLIAPAVLVLATLAVQLHLESRAPFYYGWLRPWAIGGALVGLALLAAATVVRRVPARAAMAVVVAALLLLPAGWARGEAAHASMNTTLPQAGPRVGLASRTFGSQAFDDGTSQLAAWLHAHNAPAVRWDLAVTSAQNGATMIAEHSLSVMALGGFSGSDPTITATQFGRLVAKGDIRYVLVEGGGFGPRFGGPGGRGAPGGRGGRGFGGAAPAPDRPGANAVMSAVQQSCTQVVDPSLPARYSGQILRLRRRGRRAPGARHAGRRAPRDVVRGRDVAFSAARRGARSPSAVARGSSAPWSRRSPARPWPRRPSRRAGATAPRSSA